MNNSATPDLINTCKVLIFSDRWRKQFFTIFIFG